METEYRKAQKHKYYLRRKASGEHRAYQRKYYEEHKEQAIESAKKNKQKKIDWLLSHFGIPGGRLHCDRCKYDGSLAAMQFHHIDPSQKEHSGDSLSKWVRSLSMENFQKKVLSHSMWVLCANCHAELHAGLWGK